MLKQFLNTVWEKCFGSSGQGEKKYNQIFVFCLGLSTIWLILSLVFFGGNILPSFLFDPSANQTMTDAFMDFFNSIYVTIDGTPYSDGCIYPPLAYVFYHIMLQLFPPVLAAHGSLPLRMSHAGLIAIVVCSIIGLVAVFSACFFAKKGNNKYRALFAALVMLSHPFLYATERANLILVSFLFLMGYIFLKDSKKRWLRELSYVCLALSAALKIYPAIFGLLLIKEKRWADAFKCFIWGLLFFFIPFVFFEGVNGIFLLLHNITAANNLFQSTNASEKLNFSSTFSMILSIMGLPGTALSTFLQSFSFFMGFVMLIFACIHKKKWKVISLLTLIIVGVPDFSFVYTLIFMTIPLILFLDDEEKKGFLDKIYLACFVCFFITLAYPYPKSVTFLYINHFVLGNFFKSFALLSMAVLLIGEVIVSAFKSRNTYSRRLKRAVLVCLVALFVSFILVGVSVVTRAYDKMYDHYARPIQQMANDNHINLSEINLVLAKAKWVNSMMDLHPAHDVPNPSGWSADNQYKFALKYLKKEQKPFIMHEFTVDELNKDGYFWDDILKYYEMKAYQDHLFLFVPRNHSSSSDPVIVTRYKLGFNHIGAAEPGTQLSAINPAYISVINGTDRAVQVKLGTTIHLPVQQKTARSSLALTGQLTDEIDQRAKHKISLIFDETAYDYWVAGGESVYASQYIVLSPGENTIEIRTDSDYIGKDASGLPMAVSILPLELTIVKQPYHGLADALKSKGTDFSRTINIVQYPKLFADVKTAKFIDSYFYGHPDFYDTVDTIHRSTDGIVMDLYTVRYLSHVFPDLFWKSLDGTTLAYSDRDFLYFEPLGRGEIRPDYHQLFIVVDSHSLQLDDGSQYYFNNDNYITLINPFGVPLSANLSFAAKSYGQSAARMYLEHRGMSSVFEISSERENMFSGVVTLAPGVNRIHIYSDAKKTRSISKLAQVSQTGQNLDASAKYSLIEPYVQLDEYDKKNLDSGLAMRDIGNSYFRVRHITLNGVKPYVLNE